MNYKIKTFIISMIVLVFIIVINVIWDNTDNVGLNVILFALFLIPAIYHYNESEKMHIMKKGDQKIALGVNDPTENKNKMVYELPKYGKMSPRIFVADTENRTISYVEEEKTIIISIDKIIQCELIKDGAIIRSGKISGAIAGGILGGVVGAAIGSSASEKSEEFVTSIYIRCITSEMKNPMRKIQILDFYVPKTSSYYRQAYDLAENLYSFIMLCLNNGAKIQ